MRAAIAVVWALLLSVAVADLAPKLVATPSGLVPEFCVHGVLSGSTIHPLHGGHIRVTHPDMEHDMIITHKPECLGYGNKASKDTYGNGADDYPVVGPPIWPEPFGQTLFAETTTSPSAPFSSFVTNWNVPLSPWYNDREVMFFFNALEAKSAAGVATLQPSIQWGKSAAGGGQYWSFASWYTDEYGNYMYSNWQSGYYAINEKDNIIGNITQLNNGTYYIATTDTVTKLTSALFVNVDIPVTSGTVGMSCFQFLACWELPAGPSVTFDNIKMSVGRNTVRKPFTPAWNGFMQGVCGEDYKINSPSQVVLSWTPGSPWEKQKN